MSDQRIEDAQKLPCGCLIGSHADTKAFVMVPCSATCEYYAYAIEQARKTQTPIAQLDVKEGHVEDVRELSPIFSPHCPFCGSPNDVFSSSDHKNTPKPGDVSVCAYCKRIGVFTEHGVRQPTDDEMEVFRADPNIKAMQAAAQVVWGT